MWEKVKRRKPACVQGSLRENCRTMVPQFWKPLPLTEPYFFSIFWWHTLFILFLFSVVKIVNLIFLFLFIIIILLCYIVQWNCIKKEQKIAFVWFVFYHVFPSMQRVYSTRFMTVHFFKNLCNHRSICFKCFTLFEITIIICSHF